MLYLLWAYTPPAVLEAHGIHYYPSHYWAVALPTWACATVVAAYWLNEGLCMAAVPPPGAASALHDWATRRREDAGLGSYFPGAPGGSIPALADVPPQMASLVLHAGLAPRGAAGLLCIWPSGNGVQACIDG